MHIHNSIPDVPKFLMTVRNPGIDSSTLTLNDSGKNSTSPYGLSLADTVNSAIVSDESRTGLPTLALTGSTRSRFTKKGSSISGILSSITVIEMVASLTP